MLTNIIYFFSYYWELVKIFEKSVIIGIASIFNSEINLIEIIPNSELIVVGTIYSINRKLKVRNLNLFFKSC